MKATLTTYGGAILLELDFYRKEWTDFLKGIGGIFDDNAWTIQIKHLDTIQAELKRIGIPYKLTDKPIHEPTLIRIKFDSMLLPPRDYQKTASTLMANSPAFGCFDDCGLGKTVTALAAIRGLKTKNNLILAEIKALNQWCSEIERFTGLTTTKIRGSPDERKRLWNERTPFKVVNYHLLLKDWYAFKEEWDVIVFDEGSRYLRNRDTKLASVARHLNANYKWVLTASPIENNLADVFSIYEIMDKSILGNWDDFKRRHVITKQIPVYKYRNGKRKFVEKIVGYRNQAKIKKLLSPYFIRRTPDEVGNELPELVVQDINIPLTDMQQDLYDSIVEEVKQDAQDTNGSISSLGSLTRLRRLCDTSWVVDNDSDESSKFDEIEKIVYENQHRKIIIFSQWTDPLALLRKRLDGYGCSVIVGSGSRYKFPDIGTDEDELIYFHKHNNILLSSDAGSRSLNLQVSSIIINLDLPWNPQTIKQRIGRSRRIGSEHSFVTVYNLIAKGTIEESILPLLMAKLKLAEDYIDKNIYNKEIDLDEFLDGEFRCKE